MQKPSRALSRVFNVLPGEGSIVGLLLALSICVSLARLFNSTASNTLFLIKYNAEFLPYTYMLMAVTAPLVGWLNTRLERRVPFVRLTLYNLVGYCIILGALRLAMLLTSAGWPVFVYYVWAEVGWILMNLMLWGLAARLLTVRQGKRLFGLIGAGGSLVAVAAGFLMSPIVQSIGTPNLPLAALLVLGCAIALLFYSARIFQGALQGAATTDETATPRSDWRSPRRYILLLVLMAMLTECSFYFVDIIFYKQVQTQFAWQSKLAGYPVSKVIQQELTVSVRETSAADLATFMGRFLAVMSLLALLSNLFLVEPLIRRFGVRYGLVMLPLLTALPALVFGLAGLVLAPASFLFRVATFNSLLDWVLRDTVFRSTFLILYQPLPPMQRSRLQTRIESMAMPVAQGLAGLVLAVVEFWSFTSLQINWILLGLLAAGAAAAFALGRAFAPVLIEALSRRALGLNEASLMLNDPASRAVLLRELHSSYPEAVLYALDTLEAMEYPLAAEYVTLLQHAAPAVRRDVLLRIARVRPAAAVDPVKTLLDREVDPAVRAAGFRALAALSGERLSSEMEQNLDSPETTLFVAAMVSLLNHGHRREDLARRLAGLFSSGDARDRAVGLQIVAELREPGDFVGWVLQSFADPQMDVRRAALWSAVRLDEPSLWSAVFSSLDNTTLRLEAIEALSSRKEVALPLIRQYLLERPLTRLARIACLRILGRLQERQSIPDILVSLEVPDIEIRQAALLALQHCGYRFDLRSTLRFKQALLLEITDAAHTISLQTGLEQLGHPMLLHDALETAWAGHQERVFMLLRMLYDPALVLRVRDNLALASREKRAYALEVLDGLLPEEYKRLILPLFEEVPIERRLQAWNHALAGPGLDGFSNLQALVLLPADFSSESRTAWFKSCVIQAYARDPAMQAGLTAMQDPDPLVQNTLAWASRGWQPGKERTMLSIIERVLILKTVSIFGDTPDHLLAEVADLLEEEHLPAQQTFIAKGDPATGMYIIVQGEVRIHDGERTFNTLGARDIVGEMAVLDPAPRSASVTTLEPTLVLKLDRTPLFELLADRPEVARGIIKVLAGRLREALSSAGR